MRPLWSHTCTRMPGGVEWVWSLVCGRFGTCFILCTWAFAAGQ